MEEWVIDGYNLLYDWSERSGRPKKLARHDLLTALSGFAGAGDRKVLVVLDGQGAVSELEIYTTSACRVVYSEKVSADSYIERYLFENRGKSIWVVTKDRAISQIARGGGCRVMDPKEFAVVYLETLKETEDIQKKKEARGHGFNRPFDDKLKDFK